MGKSSDAADPGDLYLNRTGTMPRGKVLHER